jgi:phosphoribosylglycinamide formyltransferase-1
MRKARLGILIGPKGRGSNMAALADACAAGQLNAEVSVVVSPKDQTPAVLAARDRGLCVAIIEPGERYASDLLDALQDVDLVCLAGYLRLLPTEVLAKFPRRVLNIHPALLPKFGGKGMYGMHVHEAVIAAGERESGCTVHFVTEHYDEGDIILQLKCPVQERDTPETLAARVLELEHLAYARAVQKVLNCLP